MKDHSNLTVYTDKKLRTLRNNLNNRLESYRRDADAKALPTSHMLHGLDQGACKTLLEKIQAEMKARSRN